MVILNMLITYQMTFEGGFSHTEDIKLFKAPSAFSRVA